MLAIAIPACTLHIACLGAVKLSQIARENYLPKFKDWKCFSTVLFPDVLSTPRTPVTPVQEINVHAFPLNTRNFREIFI
jgi:hypothetical protein